jgi:hypothetical protein
MSAAPSGQPQLGDKLPPPSATLQVFGHGFLTKDGLKMGKALGNTLDPKALVEAYGADAVRWAGGACEERGRALWWGGSWRGGWGQGRGGSVGAVQVECWALHCGVGVAPPSPTACWLRAPQVLLLAAH